MEKKLMSMLNRLLLTLMMLFSGVYTFAQDDATTKVVTTRTVTTEQWYTSPWAWVIGAAIFILLFAAILRGGNRRTDA